MLSYNSRLALWAPAVMVVAVVRETIVASSVSIGMLINKFTALDLHVCK